MVLNKRLREQSLVNHKDRKGIMFVCCTYTYKDYTKGKDIKELNFCVKETCIIL